MPFWRTYYHIVWATKNRLPLITDDIEPKLFHHINVKTGEYGGIFHAVGGTENHIHLVVSIPPKISVSDFVGKIKGSSAFFVNLEFYRGNKKFVWQKSYGVFSLGEKQLVKAVSYVQNQKQHHRERTVISWLEKFDKDDELSTPGIMPETPNAGE